MSYDLQIFPSPIGNIYLVASAENLYCASYEATWRYFHQKFAQAKTRATPILSEAIKQLSEYFAGRRREFALPIQLVGTPFQKTVWLALTEIPYGITKSYKDQCQLIKAPTAARAVGRANGLNPLSIILPCHRVIGSNGALTGYAGGLEAKRYLLALEEKGVLA